MMPTSCAVDLVVAVTSGHADRLRRLSLVVRRHDHARLDAIWAFLLPGARGGFD